jgi:CheY-like chemotaxis protein
MPGAGSTFVFTARLGIAVATAIPPRLQGEQPHVQNSLAGTSILLVEDNPINQEVAASFLQRAGAVVKLANDGAEAVALAAVHRFDAILMDLQMPVMDGFEATRRIRALVDGESIPIIGVTASAMIQDKHACLAAGMNDHIAKPIERNALIGSLLRCLHPDGAGNDDMAPGTAVDDDAAPDAAHAELKSLLAGVDVDSALRRLEGRVDLYRRLALSFIQRHGNQAPPPAASRDAVYRLAHDLKGEAGTLGLTALQGRSEELVAAVKAGCDDAEPFVAPLREALAQALRLLAPLTTQTIPSDTARRSNNEGT